MKVEKYPPISQIELFKRTTKKERGHVWILGIHVIVLFIVHFCILCLSPVKKTLLLHHPHLSSGCVSVSEPTNQPGSKAPI